MNGRVRLLAAASGFDRRWIFLGIALAVIIPMFRPLGLPVRPSEYVRNLYRFVEELPVGARVYLSFDFDPGGLPELQPAAVAMLTQMLRRGIKPICGGLWPMAGEFADQALQTSLKQVATGPGARELLDGRDYVNLGYKPGAMVQIKQMASDFLKPFPVDRAGRSTSEIEIFQNADGRLFSIEDIALIVSFSQGNNGIEAFISFRGEHKRPLGVACSSILIPQFYTYVQTGQLVGMAGGMPGAAEYEALLGVAGKATAGMDSQSIAHLLIILLIALGNLGWLVERRLKAEEGA